MTISRENQPWIGVLALALVGVLIAGCGSGSGPRLANLPPLVGAKSPPRLPIPSSGEVQVAPGDTVYSVSRRYGVSTRDIIRANQLIPPYRLTEGTRLRLPSPRRYTVAHGDTIFSIARRFGVEMSALVRLNNLAAPYQIKPGQSLTMPNALSPSGQVATRRVRPAARRSVSVAGAGAMLRSPPLPTPRPGMRLSQAAPSRGETPPRVSRRQNRENRAALLNLPARSGAKFARPLKGRLIASFGPQKGGLHNDGINIAARGGTPILAAENGVVAYAGNELRGFGNLLLVKHSDGWTTAYAHAGQLLVGRGDKVRRGQKIATVGSSGNVDKPQLHFELRKQGRAVDPRRYF